MRTILQALRKRLAAEDGFTIYIALGVMVITSLLAAAAYAAVQADTPLGQRDLEGKRAYYAARAGVNRFVYELNQNPDYWQTCPNVAKTPISPGQTQYYSYKPLAANGTPPDGCSPSPPTSGDPITTFIDNVTGTFRMRFTGYSGTGTREVKRGLIVTFRKDTPLDYLWFTIYETLDPNTYPNPANYLDCNKWERSGPGGDRDDKCRDISFITGDHMNGPTYTQDQYLIAGSPTFGRTGTNDKTESSVPETDQNAVCMHWVSGSSSACTSATFYGTRAPSAPVISLPPSNTKLLDDATRFGGGNGGPPGVQTGVTKILLDGDKAYVTNCQVTCGAQQTVNVGAFPGKTSIIYVKNAPTGCTPTYSPYNPTYPATGPCGTVYVHSTSAGYTRSLTIAAQTDIIIDGDIHKGSAAPAPVLGLTANNFVRVQHALVGTRVAGADQGDCPSSGNTETTDGTTSHKDLEIDAAILAIQHSFIVDNFDCGQHSNLNELHITGAIAQTYRGTVGTHSGGTASTGYTKDYNYDDRFAVAQPPYLFDIASSSWHASRETLCVPDSTASTGCDAP